MFITKIRENSGIMKEKNLKTENFASKQIVYAILTNI